MARLGDWLEPHPNGIYVKPADAWIDPSEPVAKALVTHGHADHARGGHQAVWATPGDAGDHGRTLRGRRRGYAVAYGEVSEWGGQGRLCPCGPCAGIGADRARLSRRTGGRVGDYKRRPDPTCAAFEPVQCDVFVTEATFALPVFRHPDTGDEIDKLIARLHANPDRCVLVGAYALGKAQRVIAELRERGHEVPIYIHGALQRLCDLYAEHGVRLGELLPVADAKKADMAGHIVMCPPGALNDRWSRRLPDPITAMASGWMRVRQRARQKNVELPLILSDHADWDELTTTLTEIAPREVLGDPRPRGGAGPLVRTAPDERARWRWWGSRTRTFEGVRPEASPRRAAARMRAASGMRLRSKRVHHG
ncbi:ligase-associated DNA damage response exonuclease [Sphingomonas sp. WKB10]|nr:ligase-associated DNA damage response exonuclease [Sphingomonas sp. WKB10]